ncbi:MAG: serine hydroxymethyltransferase [Chloroflexi bacterium]|nr:serine hydroxymethyltransferase [Chloroflexota bacterium]MCL5104057.1 serine hydroxymethyltransferase [Armatimonadota bacterium]
MNAPLDQVDPEVAELIQREVKRQNDKIVLIASENYASKAIMEAQGSPLTNKYAEGYPGKRYYGGCENVDAIESLAIQRAKVLFGADHVNVQPHSGSQANQAAYFAFMKPGDRFLSMELAHGGHLTHGSHVNFSGILYDPCYYGVDPETEMLNYDEIERLARDCQPKMIMTGATVYPRFWDWERLRKIADGVGAILVADIAHIAGLVAGGEHPSPVPYCQVVTFTTHKTLRGPRAGIILCQEPYAQAIDKAVFPGLQGGPLEHVIAAKAVCLHEALQPSFKDYQRQIRLNAAALAKAVSQRGLRLVSGGTDNHLMLVDVSAMGITGKAAQEVLDVTGIVANKNMIPFDKQKPMVTSGIRLGTPCVTTRGMNEPEMEKIADLIVRCLKHISDSSDDIAERSRIAREVKELTAAFPVYL